MDLDIEVLGKVLPKMGVLIMKELNDPVSKQFKLSVPGLLGINILNFYQELSSKHGGSVLFPYSATSREAVETGPCGVPELNPYC